MHTLQKMALVSAGAIAGTILSLSLQAMAEKEPATTALPLSELRTFTEVFGRIKQDYVEPVEDKKLINEAINGMLSGLDPHSSYLDAEAFKELFGSATALTGAGSVVPYSTPRAAAAWA